MHTARFVDGVQSRLVSAIGYAIFFGCGTFSALLLFEHTFVPAARYAALFTIGIIIARLSLGILEDAYMARLDARLRRTLIEKEF